MKSKFKPSKYYQSFWDVNFSLLKDSNIKVIACDLDNTLVPHDIKIPNKEIIDLVNEIINMGFIFVILSNNNYKRVSSFCNVFKENNLDIKYYYSSKKPMKKNFLRIMDDYHISNKELCLIGDQLLTDVYGANRLDIMSIYVNPIALRDIIFTKINRFFEKRIINSLEKRDLFKQGDYYE